MKALSKLYTIYLHPLVVLFVFLVTSGAYLLAFYNWGNDFHANMMLYINDFLQQYILSLLYMGIFGFASYYVYWIMRMKEMQYSQAFGVLAVSIAGYLVLSLIWRFPEPCTGACAIMLFLIVIVSARIVEPFWDMMLSIKAFINRNNNNDYEVDSLEWISWLLPTVAYIISVILFYGLDKLFESQYLSHLFVEDYAFFLNYLTSCLIVYSIKRRLGMRTLVNVIVFVIVNFLMVYMFYMQSRDIVVSVYMYAQKLVYLIVLMVCLDMFPSQKEKSLNWLAKA